MTANASPVCMTEEYWADSQLSIARYYYIVDKRGRDILECSAIAKRTGSDKAIPPGEPCDLVRKDFIPFYSKLGREKFLAVLKDHLRIDDKILKAIFKEEIAKRKGGEE